jgi:hypothetical protein
MWARLDEELLDHPKLFAAGDVIGRNGPALALALYSIGLLWANKHLSDGHLPHAVVRSFRHVTDPIAIAQALVQAGLWEPRETGFVIHDYADYGNPNAATVKAYRARERERKQRGRARRKAHQAAQQVRAMSQADAPRTRRGVSADALRADRARNVES